MTDDARRPASRELPAAPSGAAPPEAGAAPPEADPEADAAPEAAPERSPARPLLPARPVRPALVVALVAASAVLGIAVAGVVHHLVATELHTRLWTSWVAAADRADGAVDDLAKQIDRGDSDVRRAEALSAEFTPALVPEAQTAAFAEDLAGVATAIEVRPEGPALATDGLIGIERFAPPWERYAEFLRLAELIPDQHAAADRAVSAAGDIGDARTRLQDETDAVFTTALEQARSQLGAFPLATNRTRLDLEAVLDGGKLTSAPAGNAPVLAELTSAVDALRVSHESEQARRADPAYGVRGEIEDFARSLANGVALDFTWAYEVAGKPSDGWFAGTAEFAEGGDEWSLITLSFSIADAWRDGDAEAVVVHEVGHTQVLREACRPLFEGPEFAGTDHEMWATAWAIARGYDRDGAGIQAYGRPTDAQIAAAAGCTG